MTAEEHIGTSSSTDHIYDLHIHGQLTDGNETLSDVTFSNLPNNITLKDNNSIIAQHSGNYNVTLDTNGDSTVSIYSNSALTQTELNAITASVTSTDTHGTATTTSNITATTILGTSGNDTIAYDGSTAIDGGTGTDTVTTLLVGGNLDFTKLDNIETIDLTANGNHTVSNLTLNDVLNITDANNTLAIKGDNADNIAAVDKTGWTKNGVATHSNGTSTFQYSHDGTNDSITLTVDDNINNTGL